MARPKKNATTANVTEIKDNVEGSKETEQETVQTKEETEEVKTPEESKTPEVKEEKTPSKAKYFVSINYGKEAPVNDINDTRVMLANEDELEVSEKTFNALKKDTIKLRLGPTPETTRIIEVPRFKFRTQ